MLLRAPAATTAGRGRERVRAADLARLANMGSLADGGDKFVSTGGAPVSLHTLLPAVSVGNERRTDRTDVGFAS